MSRRGEHKAFDVRKYERPGLKQDEIEEIKEAFDLFDSDRSGEIDLPELKAAMQSLGYESKNETIFTLLSELDKDGSASLNFEEFLDLMSGTDADGRVDDPSREEISKIFDLFDIEGKNSISAGDVKRVARELGERLSNEEIEEIVRRATSDDSSREISSEEFYVVISVTLLLILISIFFYKKRIKNKKSQVKYLRRESDDMPKAQQSWISLFSARCSFLQKKKPKKLNLSDNSKNLNTSKPNPFADFAGYLQAEYGENSKNQSSSEKLKIKELIESAEYKKGDMDQKIEISIFNPSAKKKDVFEGKAIWEYRKKKMAFKSVPDLKPKPENLKKTLSMPDLEPYSPAQPLHDDSPKEKGKRRATDPALAFPDPCQIPEKPESESKPEEEILKKPSKSGRPKYPKLPKAKKSKRNSLGSGATNSAEFMVSNSVFNSQKSRGSIEHMPQSPP